MFKTTTQRHAEARDFAATAREFKDQVQQGLTVLLASQLREGETIPDVVFLQELLGRLLESSGMSVLAVDGSYTTQLVNSAGLRERRDELSKGLRERMRDVRYLLERALGQNVVRAALRQRRLSKVRSEALMQGARDLVAMLRDPVRAEAAIDATLFASAAALADGLEADAAELQSLLGQLSPQDKSKQTKLGDKVADLRTATETNRRCADLLYGLYRVAQLDFHAERVRPKRRQKRVEEKGAKPAPVTTTALVVLGG